MASIVSAIANKLGGLTGNALLNIYYNESRAKTLVCQFNPEEYHLQVQAQYTTKERMQDDKPIMQYIGGSISILQLALIFDTSSSYTLDTGFILTTVKKKKAEDVSKYTNTLLSLVKISGELHHPPMVEFCWGSLNLAGFVKTVDIKYTMFESGGMPVRAAVNLAIQSPNISVLEVSESPENPRESPDRTKRRILTEGNSIFSIAQTEYADAGMWREIAKANDIMDPMAVAPGTVLKVPALTN
ncbi:hypothetical protein LQZ18_03840 [Lachnospiraceae bacterium ZAX-1]